MDLSPPSLTQSPSSPSNTYCSSERSSLDYPSPGLVEQHYKLSPIYGAEPPCSLPASLDPETSSLPPLDAMSQSTEWGPTVIHPVSSAATMPSIVSAEYEAFNSYPYAHDVYQSHAHAHAHAHAHSHGHSHGHAHGHSAHASPVAASTPPPGGPSSRSPILAGPRTPLSYPTSAPGPMTPRVKLETGPDFGQAMDVSHYPSPRSVQSVSSVPTTYAGDNGAYTTSTTPGYMSDDGSSSWQKPNYQPVEPEQFYAAPTSHSSAFMQDARRAYRVTRPRRAPRRLTTKEEANFQCEVKGCGKLFSRSYNFKAHMETHDEKREYPFPCNVADCNKKFVRKTDLQRHHSSVHAKERNHKCDYCSRMFARKDTLRRHMEDGCSKRFDIGTLDLRADAYDSLNPSARAMTGPMGHLVPPPGGLPPMAIPPLGSSSILTSIPPSMRARDLVAGPDHTTGHWGR